MKKIFSVLDIKAKVYWAPNSHDSTVDALRSFQLSANDPKHIFNKFPDDFALMELGSFDPQTATIELNDAPHNLATARSLIQVNQ